MKTNLPGLYHLLIEAEPLSIGNKGPTLMVGLNFPHLKFDQHLAPSSFKESSDVILAKRPTQLVESQNTSLHQTAKVVKQMREW